MDSGDDAEDGCTEEKDSSSGSGSLSGSFGSSLSASQDFRRQMKPPNKKKHEEEMEELMKLIRTKEAELRSLGSASQESTASELQSLRDQREVAIGKRKKLETDLRTINQEITKKMGLLSRTESNLHYKKEAKIDDAIRNMEWQLKSQNFSLKEERKIVAEIDKLKRSKKTLQEYFTQKKEVDKLRENQRRTRAEKDNLYKIITNLKSKEEDTKKSSQEKKAKTEILRKDLNELHERKRQMIADYKQHESEYHRALKEKRHNQRKESFRKKEEYRKEKEQAWKKERIEYEMHREPFEDEKNLCNTLINYLQRFINTEQRDDVTPLPSPREEQPETHIGASFGPADSLDDGNLILLKKSETESLDYSVSSKKTQRRSRKGRKLSVTKPLAHTPQIISQFSSLTLNAPSNMSEVAASIEQLQARKQYYEEQAVAVVPRPLLGSLNSSFSSSGSMSSLESPLRERNTTWSFVDVPPPIAENQTPSDAGVSTESGFHDMSRQESKTESYESTADPGTDHVLEELIRQSSECGDGEHSRSSSDTITPEDHVTEESEQSQIQKPDQDQTTSLDINQGNTDRDRLSDYQSNPDLDSSNNSLVFEDSSDNTFITSKKESKLRGNNSQSIRKSQEVDLISNYDEDFPPVLSESITDKSSDVKTLLWAKDCDANNKSDNKINKLTSDDKISDTEVMSGSSISIVIDSFDDSNGATNSVRDNISDMDKSYTSEQADAEVDKTNLDENSQIDTTHIGDSLEIDKENTAQISDTDQKNIDKQSEKEETRFSEISDKEKTENLQQGGEEGKSDQHPAIESDPSLEYASLDSTENFVSLPDVEEFVSLTGEEFVSLPSEEFVSLEDNVTHL